MNEVNLQQGKPDQLDVDIAVVGAGLVGLPLALSLSAKGWSVALVDASVMPDVTAKESSSDDNESSALKQRCTAVNLGTQQWMIQNGFWASVESDACVIKKVNVSQKGYFGATRLSAQELGAHALGYVVNNQAFVNSLSGLVRGTSIQCFYAARVTRVATDEHSVSLMIDNAPLIRAKLLVAADGMNSAVRESTGLSTTQVDYDQAAVLGMVRLNSAHEGVAHERFTSTGPLALLPRSGRLMSFVDCIDTDEQATIKNLSDSEYVDRLQSRFGYRLGRFESVGPRFVLPLIRIESQAQIAPRTVLMGNAMRLLHPVGGQGFNLAIRDVEQLVNMLNKSEVIDPGIESLLAQFSAARQEDQQSIVRLTDSLARGFRGRASLPSHLRSSLLMGLDAVTPLRSRFAARTMGVSGL